MIFTPFYDYTLLLYVNKLYVNKLVIINNN